ncbi:MAG: ribonuclease III [Pseudomonadales bacterium]|jgi:ribonuclease-3|nr:ribonuclease III [Pseudomonadales bacterium]
MASEGTPPSAKPGADPQALQRQLGHRFEDVALFRLALTHRSRSASRNYERLEFLGDAYLGFVVAEELYRRNAEASESELTLLRAKLVRRSTLAEIARELGLGDHLRLGVGELRSGGFRRDSILADTVEAIIGAVLLDGGPGPARTLILRLLGARLDRARPGSIEKDPKTRLQELLQGRGEALPEYRVVEELGSDHDKAFRVACVVQQPALSAEGEGRSRRAAEQAAAAAALESLEGLES